MLPEPAEVVNAAALTAAKTAMAQVYLGLGGNEQDPPAQFERALRAINARKDTQLLAVSPLYFSEALGPPQADYVNACAHICTECAPNELRLLLKQQEQEQGRKAGGDRWLPRPLDIDILLYDQITISTPELTIPHSEIYNRRFVLQPLLDLDASLQLPGGRFLRDFLATSSPAELRPHPARINI